MSTRTAWLNQFPDVVVDQPLGAVTANPLYQAAKSGDITSAYLLAQALVSNEAVAKLTHLIAGRDVIIVPVHAEEALGTNQIPNAAAVILADRLGVDVDFEIVQAIKVSRTGSDGWHRLANTPYFDGKFERGRFALMVDDTLTQGGTFASLKGHIESQGGHVIGAYALTGKQYSRQLRLSDATLQQLRQGYGEIEAWWNAESGYDFSRLTEWEARYILNSGKAPDAVRDRVAAAKQI